MFDHSNSERVRYSSPHCNGVIGFFVRFFEPIFESWHPIIPETLGDVVGVEDCRAVGESHHGYGVDPQHEVPHPVQGIHLRRKQLIRTAKILVDILET